MDSSQPAKDSEASSGQESSASNPVVLQARTDNDGPGADQSAAPKTDEKKPIRLAKRTYRPSHSATFIAIFTILAFLIVVGGIVGFIVYRSQKKTKNNLASISVSQSLLSQLGVNRTAVGDSNEALLISPNAVFDGSLTVNKDVKLSSKLDAGATSLLQLDAGNTSLTQLNVNGNSTLSGAAFRSDVTVSGNTTLQGTVTVNSLMTLNNGLNVVGNLTVGGALVTNNFSARSLTSTSTLTIGGHIITSGLVPNKSDGPAVGPAGTTSISGNDSAGTIAINTGQSPSAGILITISFRTAYGNIPHVLISPIGPDPSSTAGVPLGFYVNRSATGFSIGTFNTPATATGYVFDYAVEQ